MYLEIYVTLLLRLDGGSYYMIRLARVQTAHSARCAGLTSVRQSC